MEKTKCSKWMSKKLHTLKVFLFFCVKNVDNDDYKEWRTLILSELETFVAETKRFATRPSCQ